jgi:hypothetical protein
MKKITLGKINLVATTFYAHVCGTKTYGFIIYDENDQAFVNTIKEPIIDDMALLRYALTHCDGWDVKEFFWYLQAHKQGLTINETAYPWEKVKHLFINFQ